jgi:hypothetical protein
MSHRLELANIHWVQEMIPTPIRLDRREEGGREKCDKNEWHLIGLMPHDFALTRGISGSFWLWLVAKLMTKRGHGGFWGVTDVQLIKEWT